MKAAPVTTLFALLGTWSLAPAAVMQRLPFADRVPVNLANHAILGTRVEQSSGLKNASALLSSNASDSAELMSGPAEVIISLVGTHSINEIDFSNDGAEGKMTLSTGVDMKSWQLAAETTLSQGLSSVRFANAQAHFVKVTFQTTNGGAIRGFAIYGATSDHDYKLAPSESTSPVNLADSVGGSRPIYAYPSPVNAETSQIKKNIFRFPKTTERYRILVYDLGAPRQLHQFATSYSESPTRVEVFTFTSLPEKQDWRNKMTLDTDIFDTVTATASGTDPQGIGHISLKPAKPVTAQYVAFRFEPNYNRKEGHASNDWDTDSIDIASDIMSAFKTLASKLDIAPQSHLIAAGNGGEFEVDGIFIGGSSVGGGGLQFLPQFNPAGSPNAGGNPSTTFNTTDGYFPNSNFNNFFADHAAAGVGNTNPFQVKQAPKFTIPPLVVPPIQGATPPPSSAPESLVPSASN